MNTINHQLAGRFARPLHALARHLVLAAALTATGAATVAVSQGAARGAESAAVQKPDMKKVAAHLRAHVKYPATRAQVLDACAQTDEFSAAERAWAAAALPEGTYASADEVLKALKKK